MKKKIKIAYAIPNFNTAGSGRALLNLALGLNKDEFEPHIICNSNKGEFFKVVESSGIPVHVFDYIPQSRPFSKLFIQAWKVSRQIRKINLDIVHSFHYSDNYSEAIAVRLSRAKWVFTKKNMSWGGTAARGWKLRSALANGIAVQNTDMIKQFYPTSKKSALIPRGVVLKNFTREEPKSVLLNEMKTPKESRVIICVANMVPVKGVEVLIAAFSDLIEKYNDWHLWLVGDVNNDYGKSLVSLVKERKLETHIHLAGKRPNVKEYLDHAEIFVLPTKDEGRREGSPVAMLEAMANGKLVIGTNIPGVRDQLKEYNDHVVEPNNIDRLSGCLDSFMANSTTQNRKIGYKFLNHVKSGYTIEKEIERHVEFYNKILRQ